MFTFTLRLTQLGLLSFLVFPYCYISAQCKTIETVSDFDIDVYASKPWFSQQQAENTYSPKSRNYCVRAEYNVRRRKTFWGYTVDVSNTAQDVTGEEFGGDLCAYQAGEPGKLAVAPCFLPTQFAGPYWIVAYNEDEGYALISGGQPDEVSENGIEFGCRSGTGINNSGLWIFTRAQVRDEALINKVRGIAFDAGFDLSVLLDVDHTTCGLPTPSPVTQSTPEPTPISVTSEPTTSPVGSTPSPVGSTPSPVGSTPSPVGDTPSPTITTTKRPTMAPITMAPTSSPTKTITKNPTISPTNRPPITDAPTETPCVDSVEMFNGWFGERDCNWVSKRFFRELKCASFGDLCPETCGICD